ncbi:hypothetical protein HHL22_10030 [Hymenobacter sp. RP-2-7]|uniref:Tetratricopeptide repeat protein n=1 Tax=Hymenobacter polaris TaxID=2682546 RepID=A0A7Y0ADY4_9BACT|nr:hypothetical protein [Hymenobacter polaris]NML65542.1 hypothetical protein [Hymenobacter polaris]
MQYPNGWWRLPLFLTAFLAFWSMLTNLLRGNQVKLANGREVLNDGAQIRHYLRHRQQYRLAAQAQQHAEAGRYAECAQLYVILAQQSPLEAWILRNLLNSYWLSGQLDAALASSQRLEQELAQDFTDEDLLIRANLLAWQGRYTEALAIYKQLLTQPAPYYAAYNSRGYTRSLLGQQEAALADFDHAIALEIELAYAYANRGLAWLRLGHSAKALADITHSLTLSPTEVYGYRNRGLYYLEQDDFAAALADFKQAQLLNPFFHGIEECLRRAGQQIGATS